MSHSQEVVPEGAQEAMVFRWNCGRSTGSRRWLHSGAGGIRAIRGTVSVPSPGRDVLKQTRAGGNHQFCQPRSGYEGIEHVIQIHRLPPFTTICPHALPREFFEGDETRYDWDACRPYSLPETK